MFIKQITWRNVLVAAIFVVLVGLFVANKYMMQHTVRPASAFESLPQPTSLVISQVTVGEQAAPAPVTISDVATVRALYTDIRSIPNMPDQLACTMEMGPSYQLRFSNDVQVLVEDFGCHAVSVTRNVTEVRKDGMITKGEPYSDDLMAKIKEALPNAAPPGWDVKTP